VCYCLKLTRRKFDDSGQARPNLRQRALPRSAGPEYCICEAGKAGSFAVDFKGDLFLPTGLHQTKRGRNRTAKIYLIDMDRPSQLPFRIYRFPINYSDGSIARIQDFIGEHFKEDLTIDDVAKRAGMSVRNFSRRFKSATGENFSNYIQKFRIESAKRLMESTDFSASEIMYQVGYNDERSFRRPFKRHSGLSPRQYRTKFKMRFENISFNEEARGMIRPAVGWNPDRTQFSWRSAAV
jgi:AraC-like DNA-binding protein